MAKIDIDKIKENAAKIRKNAGKLASEKIKENGGNETDDPRSPKFNNKGKNR